MVSETDLIEGFKEFIDGGLDEENKLRYKLTVTAYFKAITQICDLIILRKKGFAPTSHTERFRLLEKEFLLVYKSVDSIFKIYQDTYSRPITKESCRVIKNEIRNIIRTEKLEKEFQKIISRL